MPDIAGEVHRRHSSPAQLSLDVVSSSEALAQDLEWLGHEKT